MNKYLTVLGKFKIHPLFWFVILLVVLTAQVKPFVILFTIVVIHECGHALAATFFKWRIVKVELLPFGGVAETEEHGTRPIHEELIVILSGPIQHIWMAGGMYGLYHMGWVDQEFYELFMINNLVIFLFNLLPIWPLDGGKLVFTFFTIKFPFVKAHLRMIYFSVAMVMLLLVLLLLLKSASFMLVIMGVFLISSIYIEWKQHPFIFIRFLLERYYGKQDNLRKLKVLHATKDQRLMDVFRQFMRRNKHEITIDTGERYDENELLFEYFSEKRVKETIGDIYG